MSGPPRKPYRVRVLEGGRGHKRPLAPDLPAPATGLQRPKGLSRAERTAWELHVRWIGLLGLESEVDAGSVMVMVRLYCRAKAADAIIERDGLTDTTRTGYRTPKPEVAISRQCWKEYCSLAQQFALTPAARAKFAPDSKPKEKASDLPADFDAKTAKA